MRENVHDLCHGIEENNLPRTFKDAVQITRRLGVRYLWLDSLCIVQDDPHDWARESAVMGEVYRNGLFNISATGARDSTQGTSWGVIRAEFWNDNVERAALNRQGWVLQERILSRRVLHFSKEQVFGNVDSSVHVRAFHTAFQTVSIGPLRILYSRVWFRGKPLSGTRTDLG